METKELHSQRRPFFLRMNGYRLKVDPDNGENFIINDLIKKKIEISEIAKWLEKHMKKID
jgi:prophage maintenance system killer protein